MAAVGILCWLLANAGLTRLNGQVSVTTWHNDIGRTGQNTQETVLTPGDVDQHQVGTVTTETFGLLCRFTSVTGQIYAQPLVVSNSDGSMTVYVATMQDYVYSFQIPNNWNGVCSGITPNSANLLASEPGEYPADCCYIGKGHGTVACSQGSHATPFYPTAGVMGTPVIDTASKTLYVVAESQLGPSSGYNPGNCGSDSPPSAWYHRLHALDLTLNEKDGGPVMIPSTTVGQTTFASKTEIQRPGLLWLNGSQTSSGKASVYIGFSMMDGVTPHPSGWVFGYYGDLSNRRSPMVYATTAGNPDSQGSGGGIWQGGGGLAAGQEQSGNPYYIYFSTADGAFNGNPQSQFGNAGDSFLKLTTDLATVSDFFTPADQWYRWNADCTPTTGEGNDIDFGSSGPTVLPNGVPLGFPPLVLKSDKENYLWVLDRTNLGQFNGTGCQAGDQHRCDPHCGLSQNKTVERPFSLSTKGQARSTAAFWSGSAGNGDAGELYFAGYNDQLNRYPVNNTCPTGQGTPPICFSAASTNVDSNSAEPGLGFASTPSISSDSVPSHGIVWALKSAVAGATNPGLYAFDAGTLNALYDSNSCFTNDQIYPGKFSVPTIANGYVFVGTLTDFDIFGVIQPRTCN